MKNRIIFLLLFMPLAGISQTNKTTAAKPDYFIDSIKVDEAYLTYMDPNEIASVNVTKGDGHPSGAVFIKLKNHEIAENIPGDKLLSLHDIRVANVPQNDRQKKALYLINDKLLTDTTNIRIPAMFVKSVYVVKSSEMPYINTTLPHTLLIKISTQPPLLHLRGRENGK